MGLQNHLEKYYNLFTRIALDDPSEKARDYFSSNALLIGLMMNIVKSEEEEMNKFQEEEMDKFQEEEMNKFQEEEMNKFQEEEMNKFQEEEMNIKTYFIK